MIQFRSEGIILDVQPDQDVTFTLDNPIFEDDRVPVAVSTNVEFKLSPKNCKFFGFTPGIRRRPSRKTAACEALFNSIVAFQGELKYDDYSDKSLQYSFVGAEFDHIVTGKLTDIPFSGFEDIRFSTMVENARKGLYDEFGLPQIMRKAMSASIEYVTSGPTKAECSTVDKYANWLYTTRPYVVPAIKVRYILDKILPELELGEPELEKLLNMLAILGLYKSSEYDNRYGVKDTSPGARPGLYPTQCTLDLADSMPDMDLSDFLISLLKIPCCTLFFSGKKYFLMSNKSILASNKFVDWTAKVSDNYSLPAYEKKGYTLAFRNEDDNYTKSYEEDLGQEPTDEIIESYSLQDIINKYRVSPDYKNIRLAQTGDIYSGKKIDALLYYSGRGAAWNKYTTPIATLDIVHQAGFTKMEPAADSEDQNYDCSIDFTCPKCVPLAVYPSKQIHADGSIEEAIGLNAITPIVDFPTAGGNRPSEVYIGLLIKNNFSDKGYYFEGGIPDLSAGSEDRSEYSLAIGGENGLYNRFHKPYAEWLARDKEMLKVDLNLTASDIANLRLWVKVLVFNVRYLIKTLEITGNTTHDILHSNAELVEV